MSWIIKRDKDDRPLRMVWTGTGEHPSIRNQQIEKMKQQNALPMPCMREWAKKHEPEK